jgi:hypothetical protein
MMIDLSVGTKLLIAKFADRFTTARTLAASQTLSGNFLG